MHRTYPSVFLLLIANILLLSGRSQAQILPSFTLKASVTLNQVVNLAWTPPDTLSHTYSVRRGILTEPATIDTSIVLSEVGSTTDTTFSDTPHVGAVTYFLYVVKTTNAGNDTIRSTYAVVRIHPPVDIVRITSVPPSLARVGLLYTYQVMAVSSDTSASFKYRLLVWPGDMRIDSVTGFLQWTPVFRGYRDISLEVASSQGGRTLQNFSVSVGAGNGTVTGAVRDSATGLPVRHALIRMYESNVLYHLGYFAPTDTNGMYTIRNVDSANYYIHAYPFNPNYLPQWYNDARFFSGATRVAVQDSPVITTVNFSLLTDSVHLPIYRAQGVVTDTSGNPLKGALVIWARADFGFNGSLFDPDDSTHAEDSREGFDPRNPLPGLDFNMDDASRWLYRAFTDSLGKYSLRIPRGFYIVRASKRGYYKLFYNNEDDLFEADIVALRGDTTNINFALSSRPPGPLGEISGRIIDSVSNLGVSARVVAFREWWSSHDPVSYHRHYSVDTDSLGGYDLTDLPPGTYRIIAMPLGLYVPSWYTSSGEPDVFWRQATPIVIDGNDVANADINVLSLLRSGFGYTSISGTVSSTTTPGSYDRTAVVYRIHGGWDYAIDASGAVAGYGLSSATGAYTITGLAPGTYSLVMDSFGFDPATAQGVTPTYDASGGAVPAVQDLVTMANTTGVVPAATGTTPVAYSLDQNYPNPFNPSTQIRFSLPAMSSLRLVVYNVLGQEVATLASGVLGPGWHVVTWNGMNGAGRAVASGVYFYRLQAGSANGTFVQVRKMMLMR